MEQKINKNFTELERHEQKLMLEAFIFASNEPVTTELLEKVFSVLPEQTEPTQQGESIPEEPKLSKSKFIIQSKYFRNLIDEINQELVQTGRPFAIIENAGGYLYSTRPEYGELLQNISKYRVKRRLSPAALETLAIIAYKQPITKPEIEQVRGVNSNEVVNSLIDKELVEMVGRKDVLGKPLMYGTTQNFLQVFGLNSLEELPKLREIDEILADDENKSSESESFTLNIEVEEKPESPPIVIPEYESFVELAKENLAE